LVLIGVRHNPDLLDVFALKAGKLLQFGFSANRLVNLY